MKALKKVLKQKNKRGGMLTFVFLLCMVFLLPRCAADSSEQSQTDDSTEAAVMDSVETETALADTESEDVAADDENTETETAAENAADDSENDDSEKTEWIAYVQQFIDLNEYMEGTGTYAYKTENTRDNRLSFDINAITVEGASLALGMSYDEVLNAGFQPEEDSFGETVISLNTTGVFYDTSGNTLTLGFINSENQTDEAETVSDGQFYYVSFSYTDDTAPSFSVGNLNQNSTMEDIVNELGIPHYIKYTYEDFSDVCLEYWSESKSQYLSFFIERETGGIYKINFEGYAE